ncbi:MAG: ABC transporter ATP-binding protein [Promethearchaeota archaeon]
MLKIEHVDAGYGLFKVVQDINIEVNKGEVVSIIGPNGAGKSTIVKSIMGLITPFSGKISFLDKDTTSLKPHEIVRMGLCLIPERRRLFSTFSVSENLDMGAYLIRSKEEKRKRQELVFKNFPRLKDRLNQMAGTLSGGEQQMLACGRGLMMNPKLLILDEPSVGLAPIAIESLYNILKTFPKQGITLLAIEQNVNAGLSIADRVYVISTGKIIADGTVEDIVNNKDIAQKFLTFT